MSKLQQDMRSYFQETLVDNKDENSSFVEDLEAAVANIGREISQVTAENNNKISCEQAIARIDAELAISRLNGDYKREQNIRKVLEELYNNCYDESEKLVPRNKTYATTIKYKPGRRI